MHKTFEINGTKIKGGCQSGKKVVSHNSKSDLPLVIFFFFFRFRHSVRRDLHGFPPKIFHGLEEAQFS